MRRVRIVSFEVLLTNDLDVVKGAEVIQYSHRCCRFSCWEGVGVGVWADLVLNAAHPHFWPDADIVPGVREALLSKAGKTDGPLVATSLLSIFSIHFAIENFYK